MKYFFHRLGNWLDDRWDNSAKEFTECFFQKDWKGLLLWMGKLILVCAVLVLTVTAIALVIRSFWPWIVLIPAGVGVAVWKGDVILAWLRKSFRKWYENRKCLCNRCAGCYRYYPQILQDVYSGLAQCADILELKIPATAGMMEAPPPQQPCDGVPRFFFRLQKTRPASVLSLPTIRTCLQEAISDAFQKSFPLYAPCYIQGLYVEKVVLRNAFSYSVSIIPFCQETGEYIQWRKTQEDRPAPEDEEEVYDDVFRPHSQGAKTEAIPGRTDNSTHWARQLSTGVWRAGKSLDLPV